MARTMTSAVPPVRLARHGGGDGGQNARREARLFGGFFIGYAFAYTAVACSIEGGLNVEHMLIRPAQDTMLAAFAAPLLIAVWRRYGAPAGDLRGLRLLALAVVCGAMPIALWTVLTGGAALDVLGMHALYATLWGGVMTVAYARWRHGWRRRATLGRLAAAFA